MLLFSLLSDNQNATIASVLSMPFSVRSLVCFAVTIDEFMRRSVAASQVNFRRSSSDNVCPLVVSAIPWRWWMEEMMEEMMEGDGGNDGGGQPQQQFAYNGDNPFPPAAAGEGENPECKQN